MDLQQHDKERYLDYLKDVEIACKEIKKAMLYPAENVICDLYAIPSHNYQAYYAIIYEYNDVLTMVYAKPQIHSKIQNEIIRMYPFKYCKIAEQYTVLDGRIIMGIKHLKRELSERIKTIIENLPEKHILGENTVYIDGVFQAIRVFENNEIVKETVYRDAKKISILMNEEEITKQLDDLYLEIGEILEDRTEGRLYE